ncbi:unnamed protein product [Rotaria sp. Silwood1]|nr:unnamed protein product [Rotaria sp. Silwood1]
MISKLRRNAFDTDLLLSDQSCQDLSFRVSSVNTNEIIPISIINPRRVEEITTFSLQFALENSCKTLQQQCPLLKSSIEVTRILCILFHIGVEANRYKIHKDYFLLFYTSSSFFERAFVRCILLFNKTWKEMRTYDVHFPVI